MGVYITTRKLNRSLLDKAIAKEPVLQLGTSLTYVSRLDALAKNEQHGQRQGQKDPHLCLLRLYCLKNNQQSAFWKRKHVFAVCLTAGLKILRTNPTNFAFKPSLRL